MGAGIQWITKCVPIRYTFCFRFLRTAHACICPVLFHHNCHIIPPQDVYKRQTQQFGKEGIGWEYVTEGTSISGGEAKWNVLDPPAYREDGTGGDYTSLGIDFTKNIWDTDACILGNTSALRLGRYAKDPSMNSEGLLYSFGNAYSQYKLSLIHI